MDKKNAPMENILFLESKIPANALSFKNKVIALGKELGINPSALMLTMYHESKLNPQAKNPLGSATGLIQFIENTAKDLGTSTAQLYKMNNIEQMDYVRKYLLRFKGKLKDATDVYLTVFYPVALSKPDSFVFPDWVLKSNPAFTKFAGKDSKLTKGELRAYMIDYASKVGKDSINLFSPKTTFPVLLILILAIIFIKLSNN